MHTEYLWALKFDENKNILRALKSKDGGISFIFEISDFSTFKNIVNNLKYKL